ncbi:MAG: Arc family DNA-binding protein [Dehalococcoidia bacterium]|nr:Arc family DNA-binding protein [Dehalococcoidia bacterium]MSQ16043.1 Arc family DNA-binding protein [Dehalococcoidia bacterium]
MATLTVRNVPGQLYEQLKRSAALHRRSINSEVIVCLEMALVSTPIDPEAFLAQVRALRARVPRVFVTEQDLQQAKNEDRP